MSATAPEADGVNVGTGASTDVDHTSAERLGIRPGMAVMEMNSDDDSDQQLRDAAVAVSGEDLLAEDSDEAVDVVLLWWRDGDGDLFDALVNALTQLADNGVVWLLTPKAGRDGHVAPHEISESARTAGLQQTTTVSAGRDWSAARMVTPKQARSRR